MRLVIGYEVDDSDYSSTVLRSLGEIHAETSLKSSVHLAAVRSCGLKRNIFLLRAVSLPCSFYKARKQAIVWRKSDPSAGKAGRLSSSRSVYRVCSDRRDENGKTRRKAGSGACSVKFSRRSVSHTRERAVRTRVRIYTHVDEREDRVGGPRCGTEARRRSPRSLDDRLIVTRDRDRYFFF